MEFYKDKKVLVAGGTGLIGRPLVEYLINEGARVRISSLDSSSMANPQAEFYQRDLTEYKNCMEVCKGMDFVFNLLCIKGSPKIISEKPASLVTPIFLFNTNLMRAAKECDVKRYLYTSSLGVYPHAEVFCEDNVWTDFPRKDMFGGVSKLMGELLVKAYKTQYTWNEISIVRPANTYGPYDNFDLESAMVVPSLIKKVIDGENPLIVWGDGSQVRDFIYATDVAQGMMLVMEKGIPQPINFGGGVGYTIKNLVEIILNNLDKKPEVKWDLSKPSGDKKRIMDISRAKSLLGWKPEVSLEEGIKKTMDWYKKNKSNQGKRYDVFKEKMNENGEAN